MGSGADPSRSSIFWKLSADNLLVFKWSQAPVYFFLIHMKYVYNVTMARTINILISNWPRKRKFRQLFKTASRKGQNLAGEFMQKIYTASWNLFTLTAEADRLLCQLVMSSTIVFHWMYKIKYSCYQQSSVIHGWFVYWIFGWEMRRLSKLEIRFRMTSFSFFTLLDAGWKVPQAILALLDSFQELHLEW